jgi:hypothetical protein
MVYRRSEIEGIVQKVKKLPEGKREEVLNVLERNVNDTQYLEAFGIPAEEIKPVYEKTKDLRRCYKSINQAIIALVGGGVAVSSLVHAVYFSGPRWPISSESEKIVEVEEARTFGTELQQEMATNHRYQPRMNFQNHIITQEHCRYLLTHPGPRDTEFERWYQVGSHQWINLPVKVLNQLCGTGSQ